MSWATNYIKKLQDGETVKFRPHGNSMKPKIESGQLVTVIPIKNYDIKIGDAVLCKVKGRHFLHLVSAIRDEQYQISNNHGHINGWIVKNSIYGVLTKIEK